MAEDKVLQSKEELGLKSESSSGMSESSVPEVQEKLDLVDELSSVSLDIEKCQVVFKKESDVAGHKSTVTKEAKVEGADGKQDHPDQSSSDEEKGEDLSAGKVKESEIGSSTGDKISGIRVKLDFGDELSSGADKSDATSSDNGVDFNASLSVAATSEGKDSANQEKVNLEDELLSVSQQGSSTAAVGSLDFADKGLSDQEKSQVLSSGKSKDLEIGSSTDDKVKAIQEKLDLDDKLSSDHFTSKKESVDDDDGSKPKVGKEDNMAADGNLAADDNSYLDTSGGKDSANQEMVNLEDEFSSDQEKSQVLFSGKSKDIEIESSTGTSEDKVKAIQENLALDDKHSSDHFISKKESDGDGSKPKGISVGKEDNMEADENLATADNGSPVIIETQAEAAEENEDFPFNNSSEADKSEVTSSDNGMDFNASLSIAATSEGKDSANQEKVNLEDELSSGLSGFKKESDDDDGKSTGTSDYSKHGVRVKS
ncbi:dentin sialophosphoprotein-like [Pocillopora verrucosa]|uniref:dentin sialophosphoprotein-like n=1 Tax=Pocillopora verrucosa TaxID=203993 RepID=UPI00333F9CC8